MVILRNSIYCDGNRNVDCISHLWHMVIFLLLLLMFENFIEEGQSVLAESPKMAAATPSTNLKAETRPLFPRGLPYSPSPFNVKQFLWPSFTPLKKRKRELSGWIQVGVHLLESSPSLNLSNGAEMNKQRIPKHLYFGLNIALCQVLLESEKNSEIDKNCGRQTSPLQAAPLYCTSSNAHLHPGLACSALPPHPPNPPNHPSLHAGTNSKRTLWSKGRAHWRRNVLVSLQPSWASRGAPLSLFSLPFATLTHIWLD